MSRGVSDDAMSGKVKAIDAVECARQLEEARRVLKEKEAALAAITDQTDRAASIPPNVDNVDTPIATTTAVSSSKTPSNVELKYNITPSPYAGRKLMSKAKMAFFMGKIIELEGGIGSGKSTLGKELANIMSNYGINVRYLEEHIIRPLFNFMLSNPASYAFDYQMAMLVLRIATHKRVMEMLADDPNMCIIIDRGLIGDMVFEAYHHREHTRVDADGKKITCPPNISDEQDQIYRQTIEVNAPVLVEPDIILRVNCRIETAKSRIEKRDRVGEDVYKVDFLTELEEISRGLFESTHFAHLKSKIYDWDNNPVYEYFDNIPYCDAGNEKVDGTNATQNTESKNKHGTIAWVEESRRNALESIMINRMHYELSKVVAFFTNGDGVSLNTSGPVRQGYFAK